MLVQFEGLILIKGSNILSVILNLQEIDSMYSKNRFIIFTGVILWFLCLPPIEAQDDTSRAITSLIEASRLIDQNNKLNPVKVLGVAWSKVPVAVKSDPDAIYCHALVRMKHNLDSFSILSRLARIAPENFDIKKSHIYSALKEEGGVIACTLINKYVRQALTNEKENEFTLWAVVMTETISREEKIHLKLKTLLALPAYVAFKQNNPELKDLLEKLGIKFDEQQFNKAKTLDQQVTEAKKILKDTTALYIKTRELLVKDITTNLKGIYYEIPFVSFRVSNVKMGGIVKSYISVRPDPYYGVHLSNLNWIGLRNLSNGEIIQYPHDPTRQEVREGTPQPLDAYNSYFLAVARLQPIITEGWNLRTRLSQLDLNMQLFLRNFTLKYKEAIKTDVELSLAMNTWRQRMQQYNAQFTAIAKLDKKQQVIENRTLKLLAGKLLPLIDFSVEKELEKFQAVQP